MPYDHGLTFQDGRPLIYDSATSRLVALLKKLVGWDEFEQVRAQARAEGRRVGIGIGCYVEGTGVGPYEGGHVQVETSGRVNVSTGLSSQGQSHQTVFAQIVAEELGVPFEDVHVTTGDTRRFGYAVGTFASRAAVMSGNAIALAAARCGTRRCGSPARRWRPIPGTSRSSTGPSGQGQPGGLDRARCGRRAEQPAALRVRRDGAGRDAVRRRRPRQAARRRGRRTGLEGVDYYSPMQSTFANGMHAAIVETDPETAEIKVPALLRRPRLRPLINPMVVEGQVHGGVAQGVGGALYERMAYDDSGQLLNASFMDFLMPVRHGGAAHRGRPPRDAQPAEPARIKGAGEAGVIPGMAVFASAIEDAEGFPIRRMPISPSELFHLRQRHEGARP
jgi:CO/xanthine dehydrogenase Mo-binding subunit